MGVIHPEYSLKLYKWHCCGMLRRIGGAVKSQSPFE